MKTIYSILGRLHARGVMNRRVRVLSDGLAYFIPQGCNILDIGCGSGEISKLIIGKRPDLEIHGLEVMSRPNCQIRYSTFDGLKIPFEDSSYDLCMFVDVLHHASDLEALFAESVRVSKRYVLIKDHISEGAFDDAALKFMDWVGNRPHGVRLQYRYLGKAQWEELFDKSGLRQVLFKSELRLYPFPANLIFDRGLHFIALLEKVNHIQ